MSEHVKNIFRENKIVKNKSKGGHAIRCHKIRKNLHFSGHKKAFVFFAEKYYKLNIR